MSGLLLSLFFKVVSFSLMCSLFFKVNVRVLLMLFLVAILVAP